MLRSSLILSLIACSLLAQAQFKTRTQALNYINENNDWISGLPEFSLDRETGEARLKFFLNGVFYEELRFGLGKVNIKQETYDDGQIAISFYCEEGGCITMINRQGKKTFYDANGFTFKNPFETEEDKAEYEKKYAEKAVLYEKAYKTLQRFYL